VKDPGFYSQSMKKKKEDMKKNKTKPTNKKLS
jgi:hypothetical protein